jgi:hypothetical protein
MKIWERKPPGTLWATTGLLRDDFTFRLKYKNIKFKVSFMAIRLSAVLLYNTQRNILAAWERLLLP